MEENKNLVTEEQVAENVEAITTEETNEEAPKMYSQEDVDAIVSKSKARARARVEREYKRKYGNLETVVAAGTGAKSVEEATNTLSDFYEKKGISINRNPGYSEKDIDVLAKADATEVISGGYDDVVEEIDRLAEVGFENMTSREKKYFKMLAEYRRNADESNELAKIGVTADVLNSSEFKEFASKFNSSTPVTEIYKIFEKTQPKKEIKTMGSMKNAPTNGVKDFYSSDEISKLTEEELRNPEVWNAVRRSMTGV